MRTVSEVKREQLSQLFHCASLAELLHVRQLRFNRQALCTSVQVRKNRDANRRSVKYSERAKQLQQQIIESLWHHPTRDDKHLFYNERGSSDDPFFYSRLAGDNLHTGGVVDQLSIIRETVGYTPWYFNLLPSEDDQFDVAWKQFDDEMGFKQPFGMSTAEYRHDFFNEMSYGWNGRGWPFQN